MDISQNGLNLIKHYEGCHLESYPDPASPLGKECSKRKVSVINYKQLLNWQNISGQPWTIGVGHTGFVNNKKIDSSTKITDIEANQILQNDLKYRIIEVQKLIKVQISQNQFDALLSFAFNLGLGALQKSTLLKLVNAKQFNLAALEFLKWNKAGGQVMNGLTCRRMSEKDLFLTGKLQFYKYDIKTHQIIKY